MNPSLRAWAPVTAVPWSARACFFLHVIGLPPYTIEVGLTRVNPSKRFHDGSHFRDCSHFVMFRPSSLLASQIVPTAAAYLRRAAEVFTSELNMLRCLRMHRICLPPAQAIGGVGTYTPLDSQPCRLLQCNRDLYEAAGAADATACSRIGSW